MDEHQDAGVAGPVGRTAEDVLGFPVADHLQPGGTEQVTDQFPGQGRLTGGGPAPVVLVQHGGDDHQFGVPVAAAYQRSRREPVQVLADQVVVPWWVVALHTPRGVPVMLDGQVRCAAGGRSPARLVSLVLLLTDHRFESPICPRGPLFGRYRTWAISDVLRTHR